MNKSKRQEIPLCYILEEQIGNFALIEDRAAQKEESKWGNFCKGFKVGSVISLSIGITVKCLGGLWTWNLL